MKRRKALSTVSAITAGSFVVPQIILSGCDPGPYKFALFNWGDTELLNDIAETIIPATSGVPGAKAANVGEFIQLYISDCYKVKEREAFLKGFENFKISMQVEYNDEFVSLTHEVRIKVIESLEMESKEFDSQILDGEVNHFYSMLKGTILFGYFTSEIGATLALRYVPIPGHQTGEIPYNGERAWAL